MFAHRPPEGSGHAAPHFARLHSGWYLSTNSTNSSSTGPNPFLTPAQLEESAAVTAEMWQKRPAARKSQPLAMPVELASSFAAEPPIGRRPVRLPA